MSRKNKTLRAFLHQNENPTIKQAWDHAWKHAQKEFHARSMQDMEAKIARAHEMLDMIIQKVALHDWLEEDEVHKLHEIIASLEAEKGGE